MSLEDDIIAAIEDAGIAEGSVLVREQVRRAFDLDPLDDFDHDDEEEGLHELAFEDDCFTL